jgi:regulator of sigma E protease
MSIVIFIIILLVLVLVHEFGHFFTAKRFGVRVEEFAFGFGPKLLSKKIGETEYSLNAVPFGGYVKIFGEDGEGDFRTVGHAVPERSLINKPKWQQALVLFAGIFANFLLAWLLFSIGFMSGLPTSVGAEPSGATLTNVHTVIVSVLPKSPAENAGLKVGDKIISMDDGTEGINGAALDPETVKNFVGAGGYWDKKINVGYLRGASEKINYTTLTPEIHPEANLSKGESRYSIGISMDMIGTAKLPFFSALWQGLKLNWLMTENTVTGLYSLISEALRGHGSLAGVSGPVGMVGIVGDAYQFGFVYLLSFVALISINLAIINLIPFPALDGGRLLFLLIEKIKGSRLNPKIANMANMIGFSILILLMLFITYHDVIKLF